MNKLKVDYGLVPVELYRGGWKSQVSNETFTDMKATRIGFLRFFKKRDQVFYQLIPIQEYDNFEAAEPLIIKLARNDLVKRIPFRFNYKKKLDERIQRILCSKF